MMTADAIGMRFHNVTQFVECDLEDDVVSCLRNTSYRTLIAASSQSILLPKIQIPPNMIWWTLPG